MDLHAQTNSSEHPSEEQEYTHNTANITGTENIVISEEADLSFNNSLQTNFDNINESREEPMEEILQNDNIKDTGPLEIPNLSIPILDSQTEPTQSKDLSENSKPENIIISEPLDSNNSSTIPEILDFNPITSICCIPPTQVLHNVEVDDTVIDIVNEVQQGQKEVILTQKDLEVADAIIPTSDLGKEDEKENLSLAEPNGLQDNKSAAEADVEMAIEQIDQPIYWPYKISDEFLKQDKLVSIATTIEDEFKNRNLKGCKWAPDGSCLISNSDDNILRLYNLPQSVYQIEDWNNAKSVEEDTLWTPALSVREGGQIYDYAWFPLMNLSDPVSACFLSTACDGPVHLRDAFTGILRASYLAYNQYDEVTAAYSVAFDPYGEYIYCGFNQTVRIFNTSRPGRECTVRVLKHKVLPDLCQKGIISCIAVNPILNGVYACGSYRRTVGLYLEDGSVLCILEGHLGGVTHLSFSHDGSKLFTGGRKDSRLICWDMRNMGEEYQIFDRVVETNQRIYFEVSRNDRYLISGGSDGCIRLWDLHSPDGKSVNLNLSTDCINGVSLNPYVPILATASGQRHFPDISEDGDSDDMFVTSKVKETKEIKLWKFV